MGACCSCFKKKSGGSSSETEMQQRNGSSSGGPARKTLSISRAMTAPSINVDKETVVSGHGLALVGVTIEQDAAYWEASIEVETGSQDVLFGVATRKDQKFYRALEEQDEDSIKSQGTDLMRKITVANGDTVGVAVQHSDLPMVQLSLNGEPLHESSVNRFRGNVYPSVFLPENDGLSVKLVFAESDFMFQSPHPKFGPVIVARGII